MIDIYAIINKDFTKEAAFMHKDFVIKKYPQSTKIFLYAYLGNEEVISIPEGVTHIGFHVFADDEHPNDTITKIIIPDSVIDIAPKAFAYCRALKEVQWPNNNRFGVLAHYLFKGCDSLEKISIPKSITAITCLMLPSNLKTIEVHDDLTIISQQSFVYENMKGKDCLFQNADTIRILLSNPNYKIIDGIMVNLKHKTALFSAERNKKTIRLPDGIEKISPYCFDEYAFHEHGYNINRYYNSEIIPVEKVIIPASVKKVSNSAFYECLNLKSVVYEGNSDEIAIEQEAFINCGKMSDYESKIICNDTVLNTIKKNNTNLRLERIILIHKEIKKGKLPCTNKLRDICRKALDSEKLSTATISRDIDFLRGRFHAPIEYDSSKKGYYYSEDFELEF